MCVYLLRAEGFISINATLALRIVQTSRRQRTITCFASLSAAKIFQWLLVES